VRQLVSHIVLTIPQLTVTQSPSHPFLSYALQANASKVIQTRQVRLLQCICCRSSLLIATKVGATLSAPGGTPRLQLLPGQYTSTTNPQLLHNLLTSRASTLVRFTWLPVCISFFPTSQSSARARTLGLLTVLILRPICIRKTS
jgi:hypothetical protein